MALADREDMRGGRGGGGETAVFGVAAILLLLGAVASLALRSRLHLQNPRLEYGLWHLPWALGASFLFCVAVGAGFLLLAKWSGPEPGEAELGRLEGVPTRWYVLGLV